MQNFLGDPNLELMKTIGHTNQDVSLAVRNVQGSSRHVYRQNKRVLQVTAQW